MRLRLSGRSASPAGARCAIVFMSTFHSGPAQSVYGPLRAGRLWLYLLRRRRRRPATTSANCGYGRRRPHYQFTGRFDGRAIRFTSSAAVAALRRRRRPSFCVEPRWRPDDPAVAGDAPRSTAVSVQRAVRTQHTGRACGRLSDTVSAEWVAAHDRRPALARE